MAALVGLAAFLGCGESSPDRRALERAERAAERADRTHALTARYGGALPADSLFMVEHPLAAERQIEAAGGNVVSSPYTTQVSRSGPAFSVLADDGNALYVLRADAAAAERAMSADAPQFVAAVDSVRGGVRLEHFAATYDDPPEIETDRSFGLVIYGRLLAVGAD